MSFSDTTTDESPTFNTLLGPWKSNQTRYYRSRVGNFAYKVTALMTKEDEANYGLTPLFPQMRDSLKPSQASISVIKMVSELGTETPIEVKKWEKGPYKFPLFSIMQGEPVVPNPLKSPVTSDTEVPTHESKRPKRKRRQTKVHVSDADETDIGQPRPHFKRFDEPVTFRERVMAALKSVRSFLTRVWDRVSSWFKLSSNASQHIKAIAELKVLPTPVFILDAELKANGNKLTRRLTVQEARAIKVAPIASDELFGLATQRLTSLNDAEIYWNSGESLPSFARITLARVYTSTFVFGFVGVPLAIIILLVSLFTLNPIGIALGTAVVFWVKSVVIGLSTGIVWSLYSLATALADAKKKFSVNDTDSSPNESDTEHGQIVEIANES